MVARTRGASPTWSAAPNSTQSSAAGRRGGSNKPTPCSRSASLLPRRYHEALTELARRYFSSHGPATVQDFVWWSALYTADARVGIEGCGSALAKFEVEGRVYWSAPDLLEARLKSRDVRLLPAFDEFLVAYHDRSAAVDVAAKELLTFSTLLDPVIVCGGRVLGNWKRSLRKGTVFIETKPFSALTEAQASALRGAAERYGAFLGLPVVVV